MKFMNHKIGYYRGVILKCFSTEMQFFRINMFGYIEHDINLDLLSWSDGTDQQAGKL